MPGPDVPRGLVPPIAVAAVEDRRVATADALAGSALIAPRMVSVLLMPVWLVLAEPDVCASCFFAIRQCRGHLRSFPASHTGRHITPEVPSDPQPLATLTGVLAEPSLASTSARLGQYHHWWVGFAVPRLGMVASGGSQGVGVAESSVDWPTACRAFTRMVAVAAYAPSVHNSQPWWWRLASGVCELRAQRDRQLAVTDPDGRLLLLSCGAALHHARLALAVEGWRFDVSRLPERGKPDLLARLRITGRTAPDASAARLSHAIHLRYTDRRPLAFTRVAEEALAAVASAAEAEGACLHHLRRPQVAELATVARSAQQIERANSAWYRELAYWAGVSRPAGVGIPAGAIPERPAETTVPSEDFGHPGSLPMTSASDREATFSVLYGTEDAPRAWLSAGEALSAAWLTASTWGVSAVPMSAPIEIPSTREALHRLITNVGYPYLVLRLGIADTTQPAPERTPRLPLDAIISILPA